MFAHFEAGGIKGRKKRKDLSNLETFTQSSHFQNENEFGNVTKTDL